MLIIGIAGLALLGRWSEGQKLASSAGGVGCERADIEFGLKSLSQHERIWEDADRLASSTPRIALAGPIAELQKIHRTIGEVSVPVCMEHVLALRSQAEKFAIDQFLGFMADDPSLQIGSRRAKLQAVQQAQEELDALMAPKFPEVRRRLAEATRASEAQARAAEETRLREREADVESERARLAATVAKAEKEALARKARDAIRARWKAAEEANPTPLASDEARP
jgi:hypothetical protein